MASIKISSLGQKTDVGTNNRTFSDFHLDLKFGVPSSVLYFGGKRDNDAIADFDIQAIVNSLFNLFNTSKGQKILNPEFGINLQQYLFLPVNSDTGELIGQAVMDGIRQYEPRVTVDNVTVYKDEDNNQYQLDISVSVPALNNYTVTLVGNLSISGIKFI